MSISEIIAKILENRGITNVPDFLNPKTPNQISWSDLSISENSVKSALELIKKHIQKNHKIAIYGDYDVDGIASTAILWSTLYQNYKNVFPRIPDRRTEGYGLSQSGIDHCVSQGAKLIITVDSGIVAHDQISYAKSLGLDVIVIDHHEKAESLPPADAIIHSTSTCAAGLSYFLAREINSQINNLDLAALGVICDLVPLTGINRSLTKFGLTSLSQTLRPGLRALYEVSGILNNQVTNNQLTISAYQVGFMIGPRLNSTGRLTHALDSLRLLCTTDPQRAYELALVLNETNAKRQQLTASLTEHALSQINPSQIIVAAHESYDEGVIGLIAAKLVEKYYRPAIAISIGPQVSKASARSIPGFHITDYLRQFNDQFLGVGGHSMAAGFSFETSNLQSVIWHLSSAQIAPELLIKQDRFDLELPFELISWDLWQQLNSLQPFGLGNPTPVFFSKNVNISDPKIFGKTTKHLKIMAEQSGIRYPAVWFNHENIEIPKADLYFTLDADTFRGPGNLQLIIKNIVTEKK